ncbi:hypothetical protein AAG614_01310 [Citromicrobium bathyomarinum]
MANTIANVPLITAQSSWAQKKKECDAAFAAYNRHDRDVREPLEIEFARRWPAWPGELTAADRVAASAWSKASGREAALARSEELCDRWSDLQTELLKMPTDDPEGIIWKLDFLMSCDDGWLDPWSVDIVKPALEDVRRSLLAGKKSSARHHVLGDAV